MSNNFNENLSAFLTSRRESALRKLKENNSEYNQLCSEIVKINNKIKNTIIGEQQKLLEELLIREIFFLTYNIACSIIKSRIMQKIVCACIIRASVYI